ncbi:MAG: hypothetical protein AB8G99_20640, partial [Planctomycetaceae bacterium]
MARVFYSNFDFEHQLAGVPRKNAAAIASTLSTAWLAIADADDCIAGVGSLDEQSVSELNAFGRRVPMGQLSAGSMAEATLVPWGWDRSAVDFAKRHSLHADVPPLESVREVNSRRFSSAIETELQCDLNGSAEVDCVDDFIAIASKLSQWVAKAEFSMSSRERILGTGRPTEQQSNWARNRFDEGSTLYVEPWVELVEECGVQFEISQAGDVELIGATGLITTDNGAFAGCLIGRRGTEPAAWLDLETTQRVAGKVAECGYFGPLGIDSARYKMNGEMHVRPIQDINARYTMGRLSLGWRDLLSEGQSAAWLFIPGSRAASLGGVPHDVRVLRTSS